MNSNSYENHHQRRSSFSTTPSIESFSQGQNIPFPLQSPRTQRASSFAGPSGASGVAQGVNSAFSLTSSSTTPPSLSDSHRFAALNPSCYQSNPNAPIIPSPLHEISSITSSPASSTSYHQASHSNIMQDTDMVMDAPFHSGSTRYRDSSGAATESNRTNGVRRAPLKFTMGFRNDKCELCRAGSKSPLLSRSLHGTD